MLVHYLPWEAPPGQKPRCLPTPCGRFPLELMVEDNWSDELEEVTCEVCYAALARAQSQEVVEEPAWRVWYA